MHTVLLYRDQTAYSVLYQLNCCLKLCSCSVCMKLGTGQKVWGGGGPEQRAGGLRGFEPCARGGSCNLQLPLGGGSLYFIT